MIRTILRSAALLMSAAPGLAMAQQAPPAGERLRSRSQAAVSPVYAAREGSRETTPAGAARAAGTAAGARRTTGSAAGSAGSAPTAAPCADAESPPPLAPSPMSQGSARRREYASRWSTSAPGPGRSLT